MIWMRQVSVVECLERLRNAMVEITHEVNAGIQHSTPAFIKIFPDAPQYLFEPVEEYYPHIRRK
jgi:hypothetical protein